jgi:hypothetical protein
MQAAQGGPDLAALEEQLTLYKARSLKIGAFNAAVNSLCLLLLISGDPAVVQSNITGILTDTAAVTAVLHK